MFLEWVQNYPDVSKIKYLDEAHFVPRQLNKKKVWGLKAKRVYSRDQSLNEKSSSVTILVSLDVHTPLFYEVRLNSNNQV